MPYRRPAYARESTDADEGHLQIDHPSPARGLFHPLVAVWQPVDAGQELGVILTPGDAGSRRSRRPRRPCGDAPHRAAGRRGRRVGRGGALRRAVTAPVDHPARRRDNAAGPYHAPCFRRGIRKLHGDSIVLNGVELALERGERLGLVGANGSGKTTPLPHLAQRTRTRRRHR
ncbi:MAG: ATP-binding cassette domain-containing protein [Gammaproteobacteria bacterium]|nr:ATP-binding cassette domain-containing protein [Gammaproteobacteria bacterium]